MKHLSTLRVLLVALCMIAAVSAKAQKIYSTDHDYQAAVKVYVVDHEYQADLLVYRETTRPKATKADGTSCRMTIRPISRCTSLTMSIRLMSRYAS